MNAAIATSCRNCPTTSKGRPVTYVQGGPTSPATATLGVWFDTREAAATAVTTAPALFRVGQPHDRHVDRYYGHPGSAWTSAVQTAAHPDRHIAEHGITAGLEELGAPGTVVGLRSQGVPRVTAAEFMAGTAMPGPAASGPLWLGQG